MRYGIWNIFFDNDGIGTAPENVNGVFYINEDEKTIAGYLSDDFIIETSPWNVKEISADDFLQLLLVKNPEGQLINGLAVVPPIAVI